LKDEAPRNIPNIPVTDEVFQKERLPLKDEAYLNNPLI